MEYHLSSNPLGVLSRYGADNIISASPHKLRMYLSETGNLIKGLQIEFPPPLDAQFKGAFECLKETLKILMKRGDSKEKRDAEKQLGYWKKVYRTDFKAGDGTQAFDDTALVAYGSDQGELGNATIVRDPLYLTDTGYNKAQQLQGELPKVVQNRLDLFVQTMQMYAKSPTEEGFIGIRKALIEGHMYASFFGVNFLEAYRPQIFVVIPCFIRTCLTKTYGHDRSAHAIAESGLNIEAKEKLFITRVDLADRLIKYFRRSLHYDFGEELTRAVVAYANRSNHDIGILVQQLQSEDDSDSRQKLVDQIVAHRESAKSIGDRYNIPIPPPNINVQNLKLPKLSKSTDLTDRLE